MLIFNQIATIKAIQKPFIEAGVPPSVINFGGGLGIDYTSPDQTPAPDFDSYFKACLDRFNRLPGQEVYFEPGRSVVANCGSLVTQLLYLKNNGVIHFAVVDAGMNDLIRPALYQAQHKIQLLGRMSKEQVYQVVGPVCESSDVFGKEVCLPELQRGDLLAIRSAGAYGQSMASGYNLRPPAQAIYSDAMTISRRPVKIL